jgi:hypothetical protein
VTTRGATVAALLAATVLSAPGLQGQERVEEGTAEDTAQVRTPPDSAVARDTVPEIPDSLVYYTLPSLGGGPAAGFQAGVWRWNRADLLASRAQTLLELLEEIPGVVTLRGGDYGTPEAASAFALGGGRVRVFRDGFEVLPLDGASLDLAHVGLGGVGAVRVERGTTELRVELESFRAEDPRPMAVVEAGTGDLDTNHFRGTYVDPRALGGSLALAIERLDTRGTQGDEEGSRTGGWVRYTRHFGDRGGVRVEYRKATVQTALDTFPAEVSRSDWIVRARYELFEGLVADAFTGSSTVDQPEEDGLTPISGSRSQRGLGVSWVEGPVWGRGRLRLASGPELPSSALELEAGASSASLGGVAARWSRESWAGRKATLTDLRAWTRPFYGVSLFGSWESGERGARIFQPRVEVEEPADPGEEPTEEPEPEEPAPPTHRFTDRTGLRLGATVDVGPLRLGGAWLQVEADSLVPFGIHTDREGVTRPGGEFTGFEVSGRLALPLDGFSLQGSLQQWEEGARYLPERIYRGGIEFHDVFFESGNFELWSGIGIDGRDPMAIPFVDPASTPEEGELPELLSVPFRQSWNAYIHARILTLYLVIRYDNFTVRRGNRDYPGRVQPFTRATYGIRWTLWN